MQLFKLMCHYNINGWIIIIVEELLQQQKRNDF